MHRVVGNWINEVQIQISNQRPSSNPVVIRIGEIFTLALDTRPFNNSQVRLVDVLVPGTAHSRYIQVKQVPSACIAFCLLWLYDCASKCRLVVSFKQKRHGSLQLWSKYNETLVAAGQSAVTNKIGAMILRVWQSQKINSTPPCRRFMSSIIGKRKGSK